MGTTLAEVLVVHGVVRPSRIVNPGAFARISIDLSPGGTRCAFMLGPGGVDPLVSLAFGMRASPGCYALLVGSGVSQSAEVPTGWAITLDLIRQVAEAKQEDCGTDPAAWYEASTGKEPDYSDLLASLGRTAVERQQILRRYFEPDEAERARGAKGPQKAHRAIAQLVAQGVVRLILTTNFDRLIERALEEAGVTPVVITSADQLAGALPLVHAPPTVVKLHGDYRDTRIRNTTAELGRYPSKVNRLLDRIFDEFGLIVCGWSGEWDAALRAAIERSPTRRFSTYWTTLGTVSDTTRHLVERRGASLLTISGADSFFPELASSVQALERYNRRHPGLRAIVVARLKDALRSDDVIEVHDLVAQEVERVFEGRGAPDFPTSANIDPKASDPDELRLRIGRYEALADTLLALYVTGCAWDTGRHRSVWLRGLERLASDTEPGGVVLWLNLQLYPAVLLLYGAGLSALAAEQHGTLAALLGEGRVWRRARADDVPLLVQLDGRSLVGDATQVFFRDRRYTPTSDYLCGVLREPLRPFIADDNRYERLFDRFEYLLCLVAHDVGEQDGAGGVPETRLGWRHKERSRVLEETQLWFRGDSWLLRQGLFGGSVDRLLASEKAVEERLRQRARSW